MVVEMTCHQRNKVSGTLCLDSRARDAETTVQHNWKQGLSTYEPS